MSSRFLSLILLTWLVHSTSYAFDTVKLPFLDNAVDFKIELKGNKKLLTLLKKELSRQRQNNRQLQQYSTNRKIARYETRLLNKRLRAEGYYANEVTPAIQRDRIVYRVNPGPVYHIQKLTLELPPAVTITTDTINISQGDPLRAKAVHAAQKSLADTIAKQFCLYLVDVDYQVTVFHETRTANVILHVKNSQAVTLGDITFTGLKSINEDYIRKWVPIQKGDCFKRNQIDKAHLALMQTQLLTHANIQIGEPIDGSVPISVNVVERYHRTISVGAGFESDEGIGLSTGWEHRNIFGQAEKVSIDAYVGQNQQTLSSSLTLPHFLRNKQAVTLYTDLEHQDTDAFESKLATIGAEISRQVKPNLRGIVGTELEFSDITDNEQKDTFALLSLPFNLEYDKRNDHLDPNHGWVASGTIRPYWDIYDTSTQFIKSTLAASAYISFEELIWQPTLALRGALGTISGINRNAVPANIRYYVGGGGSVRGYPFQSLGPMTDANPDGGLSFTEVSMETRLRWSNTWGGVMFLDGGYAYEDRLPQLGQNLRWGAGLGVRYYTSFAPIRFDVAVPLDKRDAIDDDFQVYISIGQAF